MSALPIDSDDCTSYTRRAGLGDAVKGRGSLGRVATQAEGPSTPSNEDVCEDVCEYFTR